MYFFTSSEPTKRINEALVSVAMAFASMVFPHPGGPCIKTPFGGSTPIFSNSSGFVSGSSIVSFSSTIASFKPPTFEKLTFGFSINSIAFACGSFSSTSTFIIARVC